MTYCNAQPMGEGKTGESKKTRGATPARQRDGSYEFKTTGKEIYRYACAIHEERGMRWMEGLPSPARTTASDHWASSDSLRPIRTRARIPFNPSTSS